MSEILLIRLLIYALDESKESLLSLVSDGDITLMPLYEGSLQVDSVLAVKTPCNGLRKS